MNGHYGTPGHAAGPTVSLATLMPEMQQLEGRVHAAAAPSIDVHATLSDLQSVARAARLAGLATYSSVVLRVCEQLAPAERSGEFTEAQALFLRRWARTSLRYLEAREDFRHAAALVDMLGGGSMPALATEERIELLRGLLTETTQTRPHSAQRHLFRDAGPSGREKQAEPDVSGPENASVVAPCETAERKTLEQRLGAMLEGAPDEPIGVLSVGLQGIENIVDSFGRDVGNAVLGHVAGLLAERVVPGGWVARSGDHQFVVVIAGRPPAGLSGEAARLIAAIERSHEIAGQPVAVSARVGVAVCPEDGREAQELLGSSEVALHQASMSGRQPVQFFAMHMRQAALRRVSMEAHLRRAIETESFELHYQPKIAVRSGELCGVEALLRWRQDEHRLILPAEFIPIAEQTGLIVPLGEWVIDAACRQLRRWQEEGGPAVAVAVNLSAVQLGARRTVERILEALERHAVPARLLEFEITETAVMGDPGQIADQLASLARLGVALALDDFGTGYSNLAQLGRLPLAALKLDKSVVLRVATHARAATVLGAIIGIGHALGMRVVAEGVETREQLEALRVAGCDECQGYLIAKPMSAAHLHEWVRSRRGQSRAA